jgi:RNA polymerase subunit RPABC4/transcription elongation factor Spt4
MPSLFPLKLFFGHCAICARCDYIAPVEGAETPLEREGLVYLCPVCMQRHLSHQWRAQAVPLLPTTSAGAASLARNS